MGRLSLSLSAASLGGSFKVGRVRAGFYLSAGNTLSILFGTILFGAMQGLWGRSAESLWPLDVRSTLCQWWQPKSLQTWADALGGGHRGTELWQHRAPLRVVTGKSS